MADSVQVLDPNYKRISGAIKQGKLHKGHGVIAAHSSIPSKYQTIVTKNADQKGFGATSKRFHDEAYLNENPGPGTYVRHGKPTLVTPSHSKKGLGVGFVSKTKRTKKFKGTVGPGAAGYDLPSLLTTKKDFNQAPSSSSFHKPIAIKRDSQQNAPAPNAYQVSSAAVQKHYGSQHQASFKSTSKRVDFNRVVSEAPAPCHYNINDNLVKSSAKVPYSSFKSSAHRDMMASPPAYPGPGHYRPNEEVEPASKQVFPKKHYLCISAPAMPLPPPLPEPGPGSYELVNYRGPPKHYMSSAAFVSTTSRWTGDVRPEKDPGPATYRPFTSTKRQSFLYNAQKKWVFP